MTPSKTRALSMLVMAALPLLLLFAGCTTRRPQPKPDGVMAARPADAMAFAGHWYKVFDEKVSWQVAKTRCECLGGTLACIESENEQRFVAQLADGRYLFLGGTDEAEEGSFVWLSGAPFAYTRWMVGQPNNYGDGENYLATYDDGEWVDVAADGDGFWMPTGFICEWSR